MFSRLGCNAISRGIHKNRSNACEMNLCWLPAQEQVGFEWRGGSGGERISFGLDRKLVKGLEGSDTG